MKSRRTFCVMALAAAVACATQAQPANAPRLPKGFQDPLVTPAPQLPSVTRDTMMAVAAAGKRLVAVGAWGAIIASDDAGKSWQQVTSPVSSNLVAIHFPDARHGWIVGHDGVVLHSADGGRTWGKQLDGRKAAEIMIRQYEASAATDKTAEHAVAEARRSVTDNGPAYPFLNVWFKDASEGYIVGPYNFIFRTSDGGKNWVSLFDKVDNPNQYHLNAVGGAGGVVFLVGEKGMVLRQDPGRDRFVPVSPNYNGSLFGLVAKPDLLLAYGLRGNAFRSSDGGSTWQKCQVPEKTSFTGGVALPDGRLVLVSQGGQAWVSADNAASFARMASNVPGPRFGVTGTADGKHIAMATMAGALVESVK